jgi:DNA helicase II / ATP-dependent DNA helicase PcrA
VENELLKKETIPLNPAQKEAAHAPAGPLLIVAGAGTGKTRTLTSRIAYFMELGIRPERICAITFTNKAAKEMADRVAKMAPPNLSSTRGGVRKPFIGTFHSLGARILRKECYVMGRQPNFTIFDDHDSFDVLKKILKPDQNELGDGLKKKKDTPAFFMGHISKAKNLGTVENDQVTKYNNGFDRKKIISVLERYDAALLDNNAFDFDDLIEKVVALFKSNPRVLAKYQNMFDAILVDEYQDINPKQHELVKLLASGHRNLSVVGDDEQTIYGWRYADISIFLNFEREWPGAKVYFLEENYRSTGSIIRSAAAVVKNNRVRAPKNLYTKNPDGEQIGLREVWSENDEAEQVAAEIAKIKSSTESSAGYETPSGSPLEKDESVGILYRTNAQSRAIEQALIRRDIPYRIFGGLKFYERREVKDIVAGLRFAANPRDTISRERLEKNLTKKKFGMFRARIAEAGELKLKPADAMRIFLETYDYIQYLNDHFMNADERQENVAELTAFAGTFADMSELLEKLSLLQATDDENRSSEGGDTSRTATSGEAVNLMTMHMAKGLEFDVVFLIGVAEGILPHARSMDKELAIEEERRLMYVAMTRARKKLQISFYGMPSRFIGEIPEDCIRIITTQGDDSLVDSEDENMIRY